MQLYNVVGSPNCRKVLAAASHLGVKLDIVHLDFFAGDLLKSDYAAVNPNRMVPALRDGDFALWESNAIMQYLAEGVPGNTVFPRDARKRADIVRWQCWELAHFNKAFGTLAFESVAKPNFLGQEGDRDAIRLAQRELARFAPVLDAHMKGRRFVVGDALTLADYSMIHLEVFEHAVPFDWSPYAHIQAYFERARTWPHWSSNAAPDPALIGKKPAALTA